MKGSAVFLGLKSLLHPQLPLSPKESQRLLTALTTSFRQQLDEAHPQPEDRDTRIQEGKQAQSKDEGQFPRPSSAALTDRHLASVLTNPLLTKVDGATRPPFNSGGVTRENQHRHDPISVLEEAHRQGTASIALAEMLLKRFLQAVDELPEEDKQSTISSSAAGKRTLGVILNSELCRSSALKDDFMDILAPLVIREGGESSLWDWFKMDIVGEGSLYKSEASHFQGQYRWKSRLLKAILKTKIDNDRNRSFKPAFDAFFQAHNIKRAASGQNISSKKFPVYKAVTLLCTELWKNRAERTKVDTERFEAFTARVAKLRANDDLVMERRLAELSLIHPRHPSPQLAFKFLKKVFSSDPPGPYIPRSAAPFPDQKVVDYRVSFMVETAAQLHRVGQIVDAAWVLSLIRQHYPQYAHVIEQTPSKAPSAPDAPAKEQQRIFIPVPTFT